MPQLQVNLLARVDKPVAPGDFSIEARISNPGDRPAALSLSQAANPSLALEVQAEDGRAVALPPPTPPTDADLETGEVQPGATIEQQYAGFLDRSLKPGRYRVRFAGTVPALGGTANEPLLSDWFEFTLLEATDIAPVAERLTVTGELITRFFILEWILRFIHWLGCLFGRLFGNVRCDRVLSREVDEARTETISNAPPGAEAWNGTYGWRARFRTEVDENQCRITVTIRIRLVGTISAAQRQAQEAAIEAAWSNLFKLCCRCCCCNNGYTIVADVQFVDSGEHHIVNVRDTTTNMTNWGRGDTVDVSHEVGHMLGALDEYFTVNGTDFGAGRQPGGNIMNNPANPPEAHHYDLVREAAQNLLGTQCRTVPVTQIC